jgi:predicted DNA-binding protein
MAREFFFTMRLDKEELKELQKLSRRRGMGKAEALRTLIRESDLIPNLPDIYVERLSRIAKGKRTSSLSSLITQAVVRMYGAF